MQISTAATIVDIGEVASHPAVVRKSERPASMIALSSAPKGRNRHGSNNRTAIARSAPKPYQSGQIRRAASS